MVIIFGFLEGEPGTLVFGLFFTLILRLADRSLSSCIESNVSFGCILIRGVRRRASSFTSEYVPGFLESIPTIFLLSSVAPGLFPAALLFLAAAYGDRSSSLLFCLDGTSTNVLLLYRVLAYNKKQLFLRGRYRTQSYAPLPIETILSNSWRDISIL